MILLCKLAIKSFSPTLDNGITTELLVCSITSFLNEKVTILCSDIFKWASILQVGHDGSSTGHLELFHLCRYFCLSFTVFLLVFYRISAHRARI